MAWELTKPSVSKNGKCYQVHFRNPKSGVSVIELAQRLIEIRLIVKVSADTCEGGFIVKVWLAEDHKYAVGFLCVMPHIQH